LGPGNARKDRQVDHRDGQDRVGEAGAEHRPAPFGQAGSVQHKGVAPPAAVSKGAPLQFQHADQFIHHDAHGKEA